MKILFDHQIFSTQRYGGISRYFYELMKRFEDMNEITSQLSVRFSNNYYIRDSGMVSSDYLLEKLDFRGKDRLRVLLNKRSSVRDIKEQNYDIIHPTYYDPYFLKYIDKKPFVLTIHDMIHEIYPELAGSNRIIIEWKKVLAEKATKIIAVSHNTKKDIMRFYNIDEGKIEVIYHGNSLDVNKTAPYSKLQIDGEYVLFVGIRQSYKNFDFLLSAIASKLRENSNLKFVCAGGGAFTKIELEVIKSMKLEGKVLQYSINDFDLAALYKKAKAFVFPSYYEGFGIPILEAFACGCPVILSNCSSLPEVAEDGAIYFDPYDKKSLSDALEKLIYSREISDKLILKGYEQLKKFSWNETAEKTKELYLSILQG